MNHNSVFFIVLLVGNSCNAMWWGASSEKSEKEVAATGPQKEFDLLQEKNILITQYEEYIQDLVAELATQEKIMHEKDVDLEKIKNKIEGRKEEIEMLRQLLQIKSMALRSLQEEVNVSKKTIAVLAEKNELLHTGFQELYRQYQEEKKIWNGKVSTPGVDAALFARMNDAFAQAQIDGVKALTENKQLRLENARLVALVKKKTEEKQL